jgi:hypothetical protein
MRSDIREGKYNGWEDVHQFFRRQSQLYQVHRNSHAIACLRELGLLTDASLAPEHLRLLADEALETRRWMLQGILESRQKDYANPFRQMVYETDAEMEQVLGRLDDNTFIQDQQAALSAFETDTTSLMSRLQP